jgi:hypothetical protein
VPKAAWYDPDGDRIVERSVDVAAVESIVEHVLQLSSGRGYPAVELVREDSSSLSIATDGQRAFLVWINTLGDSHHSTGNVGRLPLAFDHFGSWSEAPAEHLVTLVAGMDSARQFLQSGIPDTPQVIFSPD